jgi:hypothetical protein
MLRYLTLMSVLVPIAGCAGMIDPFQRAGTWSATNVNDDNLRAMVVNPVDLQQGVGAKDTPGVEAAVPVTRLRNDNVKSLPESTLSEVGGNAGSGGQGGSGGGGGTGATQ